MRQESLVELVYEKFFSHTQKGSESQTARPMNILSTISGSKQLIWRIRESTNRYAVVTARMWSLLEEVSSYGIKQIKRMFSEHGIDCDFRESGMLEVAMNEKQIKTLCSIIFSSREEYL